MVASRMLYVACAGVRIMKLTHRHAALKNDILVERAPAGHCMVHA
jgi:hypothetical protein